MENDRCDPKNWTSIWVSYLRTGLSPREISYVTLSNFPTVGRHVENNIIGTIDELKRRCSLKCSFKFLETIIVLLGNSVE